MLDRGEEKLKLFTARRVAAELKDKYDEMPWCDEKIAELSDTIQEVYTEYIAPFLDTYCES
jgi:hypothetical protein